MKTKSLLSCLCFVLLGTDIAWGSPQEDLKAYQGYFTTRFPDFKLSDFSNGSYNFNPDKLSQYEDIMQFPPYTEGLEEGEALFKKPFKNGKTLGSCFDNNGEGIAQNYPMFDPKSGKVQTLARAINECLESNNEKTLDYLKGNLVKILAYMADTSRGKPINVVIPNDPRALKAYEDGKRVYFTRRGPMDFACSHCHWDASGQRIRGNELSPALGQAANFPVYRSKWGDIGTLQRRFKGCMNNIGAVPLKVPSEAMDNLEYFHTYLSNNVPLNAPNSRF